MKKKKRKLKKDVIFFMILFITITIISITLFKALGLIVIPIMIGIIYLYYNIDKVVKRRRNSENKEEQTTDDNIIKSDIQEELKKDEEDVIVVKKPTKKRKNSKSKNKSKEKKHIGKKILIAFLIFIIVMILLGTCFMIYIAISAGKFDPNKLATQDQTVVYDANNEVIDTLGLEKRESVKYEELPQVLVDAIIATEDSRFFQHNGVDMPRFLKASVMQLLGNSDAGGASTLTMQVSKNNLTSTNSSGIKGIIRKFKDIYISVFQIEKQYTKEQIIEFYVNDNCLGGRIFGVGQASEYYFGKPVGQLSLPEAALLAGMFQSPNGYNPYKNPDAAYERRKTVLSLMVRHGYITQEEADLANSVSIESMLVGSTEESGGYQGFIDTVVSEVEEKTGDNPYTVPMKIYTTMNREMQDGINSVLTGEETDFTWADDKVQAGIAVVDVNTGAITAIGAGRNREQGWNYATQSKRHPGSTAKPLFDYGPGFEYNNYSTYTLFNDEPWEYSDGKEIGNWDGAYQGLITLRQALSVSRNIPALKAFQEVDKKDIIEFVTKLGIEVEESGGSIHEAHAIGGFNPGASPLQMAAAYAAFANGGYYAEPYSVTKIEYRSDGEVVEFKSEKERAMSDSTAYLMNNVLQYAVEHGFNGGARVPGSTVAAKTGTSNLDDDTIERLGLPSGAVNDLWTVAYTPEYSVALWYGYETVTSENYLSGASAPKDAVMASIMKYIPKTTKQFEMPDTVVQSQVEFGTWPAQLPSEHTPSDLIRTEYFKKGTQPTEVSDRFATLNDVTNLSTNTSGRSITLSWDFKVPEVTTEEYLKKYFSQSVFGNGTNSFVQQRLNYNNNNLGGLGFGIYQKNADGSLDLIAFTQDTTYTYNPPYSSTSRQVTLVVKAQYSKFVANASKGVETQVTIGAGGTIPGNPDDEGLNIEMETTTVMPQVGKYEEEGITITYNGEDVTNKSVITYTLTNNGTDTTYHSESELENAVNALPSGTYVIKYDVTYEGQTAHKYRNVILHD